LQFAGIVAGLERERDELKRELVALREETRDQHDFPPRDSPPSHEFREKIRHAMDTLRNKNKHISQLLNDVEVCLRLASAAWIRWKIHKNFVADCREGKRNPP